MYIEEIRMLRRPIFDDPSEFMKGIELRVPRQVSTIDMLIVAIPIVYEERSRGGVEVRVSAQIGFMSTFGENSSNRFISRKI
jgi:hypothetical protein